MNLGAWASDEADRKFYGFTGWVRAIRDRC